MNKYPRHYIFEIEGITDYEKLSDDIKQQVLFKVELYNCDANVIVRSYVCDLVSYDSVSNSFHIVRKLNGVRVLDEHIFMDDLIFNYQLYIIPVNV